MKMSTFLQSGGFLLFYTFSYTLVDTSMNYIEIVNLTLFFCIHFIPGPAIFNGTYGKIKTRCFSSFLSPDAIIS